MQRTERWSARLLTGIDDHGRWMAIGLTAAGLAICWWLAVRSGSAIAVSRHWFYVPVVLASVRFGFAGAVTTGIAAGILAGPLSGGLATVRLDIGVWGVRAAFFVGIGVVVAALVTMLRRSLARDLELARREGALAAHQATFIQTVSHEFRTPLTVLRGGIQILDRQRERIDPSLRPLVASLLRAERRLDDMVSVILATAEAADASRQLETEPVRVGALCKRVIASLHSLDAPARVRTELGDRDQVVVTVPAHLEMILSALLDNALRFSPDGQPVTIRGAVEPDRAIIEIRDHGPGMDDQLLAVAFDPFTQGDGSSRRAHDGLGLGLFTAQRLTERLGGTLTTTPADPGLTVTVTLPQQRTTDHEGGSVGRTPSPEPPGLPEAERNTRPHMAGE